MTPPLNWIGSMRVEKARRKSGRHSFAIFSGASLKTPGGSPSVLKALPAKRCSNTKSKIFKHNIVRTIRVVDGGLKGFGIV